MYDDYSEMIFAEQRRKAIHAQVRHQHLANQIHRADRFNSSPSNWGWLNKLRQLYRLRIHITFDLEEPSPKPNTTG